jgi:uncharacterized protein
MPAKYRPSSYNIRIPLNDAKDLFIHGYTGAVDIVGKKLADRLDPIDGDGRRDYQGEQIGELIKRGYLTDLTEDDERQEMVKIAKKIEIIKRKTYSFIFLLTYECNFRCGYCFERGVRESLPDKTARLSSDQIRSAFEFIDSIPLKDDSKEITLYGGEPLLEENHQAIRAILDRGKARSMGFWIITNGYELDSFEKELSGLDRLRMQVSIDGPAYAHDARRRHRSGGDTYGSIIRNLKSIRTWKRIPEIRIRMNASRETLPCLPELVKELKAEGILDFASLYVSPVRLEGACDLTVDEIRKAINSIKKEYGVKMPLNVYSEVYSNLQDMINKRKMIKFQPFSCEANNNQYIFDPLFDIYNCLETVGKKEKRIGCYDSGVRLIEDALSSWRSHNVSDIPECSICRFALLCGGGCTIPGLIRERSFTRPDCGDFKNLFCEAAREVFLDSIGRDKPVA